MNRRVAPAILAAAMVVVAAAGRVGAQPAGGTAEAEIATAPVVLDGVVLLRVRGVTSFPAETRAALIQQRLETAAADSTVAVDSVSAVDQGDVTRIVAGGHQLMAIVDADAAVEQASRADLAAAVVLRLRQAISEYRAARSASALRSAAIATVIATVVLGVAVVLMLWLWRAIDRLVTRRLSARIHSIGIQSFELMRAEQIWSAGRSALRTLRALAILVLFLMYVGYVLAQFPWTRTMSAGMTAFAMAPLEVIGSGVVQHIPSLVFLAVLVFLLRLTIKVIRLFFEAIASGSVKLDDFDPEWALPTYKIVRLAVVVFGLVVAYPYIPGSESAAFKGVSVFVGIVFSLGSSTVMANIMAGYMLTYRRAFKVGDRVKIGEVIGDVLEVRLQVTRLFTIKHEEVIVPNSQIMTSEVMNYSSLAGTRGLILHTEVGIGYETPWRQVEAMLIMAAERTPGLNEPRPFVLQKRLGDFAVIYELNAYCFNVPSMVELYAALHRNILDVFNEYGVQIMTPAYMADPKRPKIVDGEHWYLAPAAQPAAGGQPPLQAAV